MPRRPGAGGIDGVEEQPHSGNRPAGELDGPRGRFGLLLLLLVSTYLLSALTKGHWVDVLQLVLFAVAALLALRSSSVPPRTVRLITLAVLTGTAIMLGLSLSLVAGAYGTGIANLWTALILLFAAVVIVVRVLSFSTVTIQSIYGAISAYLIIGLMFAAIFAAIYHLTGSFFLHGEQAETQTFQYFSFSTLTTLGYGDYTAAGNAGRAIAVLEALTGQIFLATLVARLVAAYRAPDRQR